MIKPMKKVLFMFLFNLLCLFCSGFVFSQVPSTPGGHAKKWGIDVEIKGVAEVSSDVIYLKDIANFNWRASCKSKRTRFCQQLSKMLKNVVVGYFSDGSVEIFKTAEEVEVEINKIIEKEFNKSPRELGINIVGAKKCAIYKKGEQKKINKILTNLIEKKVKEYIKRKLGLDGKSIEVVLDNFSISTDMAERVISSDSNLMDKIEVVYEETAKDGLSTFVLKVTKSKLVTNNANGASLMCVATCYPKFFQKVVVAKKNLYKGAELKTSDVALERREITLTKRYHSSLAEVVGKKANKMIAKGEIIEMNDVKMPAVIKKGEMVTLINRVADFIISVPVIALSDGSLEEVIKVSHYKSRKIMTAKVVSKDKVELVESEVN